MGSQTGVGKFEVHYTEPAAPPSRHDSRMMEYSHEWADAIRDAAAAEKSGRYNISIVRRVDGAQANFFEGRARGWRRYVDGHWIDA